MTRTGRVFARVGFGLMTVFTVLGGLFIAGYAFEDPGGWAAVGLVASWLVPLAILVAVARLWPDPAVWVFAAVVALEAVVLFVAQATGAWSRDVLDAVGPVPGIAVFVLGLPLAVLGLRRPLAAGLMLVAMALLPYVAFLVSVSDEPWQGLGASLTTSSTVTTVPYLFIAAVFLVASFFHGSESSKERHVHTPGPTTPTALAA